MSGLLRVDCELWAEPIYHLVIYRLRGTVRSRFGVGGGEQNLARV